MPLTQAAGPRRHPHRAEDLAASRRGPRQHQRRPAAGGAHPGQSEGAGGVQPVARRRAHVDRQRQHQSGQGQLRRPDARVDHRRQRPAEVRRRIPAADHRLPQRRAGAACRTSPTSSTAPRTRASPRGPTTRPAIILNIQRQPGANVIEVVDRVKALLPQLRASLPAAVDVTLLTDRTVTIRARCATCSSSSCSPSRWW